MSKQLPKVYTHSFTEDDLVEPRKSNEVASEVMKLIEKEDPNKAKIFVKDGDFGQIKYSTKEKTVGRDKDNKPIKRKITKSVFEEFVNYDDISGVLNRTASFYKLKKSDEAVGEVLLSDPPRGVSMDVIKHQNKDKIPYLTQIINHPTLTNEWEIINEPGYHKDTQFYLEPTCMVPIDNMDVNKAYDILAEWLSDFPFKDYSDICNALSLLFTILMRPALPEGELPPLFIITANSQGAGKSTLAQILSVVITGKPPGSTQLSTNEEEMRKAIGAELILGTEVVVLDNITEQVIVASSSLASAISEPIIRFRVLGKSKMKEADNNATYILTGNNVDTNADLVDRACFIRLDTEKRVADRNFRTEAILDDTLKYRNKLFSAVHTIVKTWIDEGKQRGDKRHRSNVWAKYMSGIFNMLNEKIDYKVEQKDGTIAEPLTQFLENDIESRKNSDPEFADWVRFRDAVHDALGKETEWYVGDVLDIASYKSDKKEGQNLLSQWFKHNGSTNQRSANLGKYISNNVDKVFGHWKFVYCGEQGVTKPVWNQEIEAFEDTFIGRKKHYMFKDLREQEEEDDIK